MGFIEIEDGSRTLWNDLLGNDLVDELHLIGQVIPEERREVLLRMFDTGLRLGLVHQLELPRLGHVEEDGAMSVFDAPFQLLGRDALVVG